MKDINLLLKRYRKWSIVCTQSLKFHEKKHKICPNICRLKRVQYFWTCVNARIIVDYFKLKTNKSMTIKLK